MVKWETQITEEKPPKPMESWVWWCTSNPSTQEAEAGGSGVQGQPGLYSEFQDSQGYIMRPCLKKKKNLVFPRKAVRDIGKSRI